MITSPKGSRNFKSNTRTCLSPGVSSPSSRKDSSKPGEDPWKGTVTQNCEVEVHWLDSPPVPYSWEVPLAKQHSTSAMHSQAHGGPTSRLHHSRPLIDHNAARLSTEYLCSWGSRSGTQLAISCHQHSGIRSEP